LAEYVGVLILLALISVPVCLWGLWGLRRGRPGAGPPPPPVSGAEHRRAGAGFFLPAVVFLVFQAGALVLVPWALSQGVSGVGSLVAAGAFGLPLGVGFVYLWRRGALRW
jgi:NADH:ubiquinone oxidoreductase subunit 3 (subunit A)